VVRLRRSLQTDEVTLGISHALMIELAIGICLLPESALGLHPNIQPCRPRASALTSDARAMFAGKVASAVKASRSARSVK
jgi:hypothetical protein